MHGDFALETNTDFLAVASHQPIPSRARNKWSRLRQGSIHSAWARQTRTHPTLELLVLVLAACGVPLSLCLLIPLPSVRSFYGQRRIVRCALPIGGVGLCCVVIKALTM